jgi:hypothetical protein
MYSAVIAGVFLNHYSEGITEFEFDRAEIVTVAEKLNIERPKNLGDLIYSFKFRRSLPETITSTATGGLQWIIEGAGTSKYRFRLTSISRIEPNISLLPIKIPDSTPEIILKYAQTDEQALLAKVRYNRLVDIFLSLSSYSLQSHLKTNVPGIGQIEIDEVYVAINSSGSHFIVPVQAKGGSDQIGVAQTTQDLAFCRDRFPELIARPVSAQFMKDDVIALFELAIEDGDIYLRREQHYRLVPGSEISDADLRNYRLLSDDPI